MRPGVQANDVVIGSCDEALRGKVVFANVRMFLLDGTELPETFMPRSKLRIDLARRDCIAGIRYGIEGMRVGGQRELVIRPHLAYGERGVPGHIPPNAPLRCEVELLEVRERGVMKPEDYPPGRQLSVGWLGDLQHGVAKWQFWLNEDGRYGAMVTVPIPGLKWRHARPKLVASQVDRTHTATLFEEAQTLPERYPKECLTADQVCVDHSGQDGGVHRDRETDSLCLAVSIWERRQLSCSYYVAESSQAWMTTGLHDFTCKLIAPVLEAAHRSDAKRGDAQRGPEVNGQRLPQ